MSDVVDVVDVVSLSQDPLSQDQDLAPPPSLPPPTITLCIDGTLAHHWVIDQANGPTSQGRCKRCEQSKVFFNWNGELSFSDYKDYWDGNYAARDENRDTTVSSPYARHWMV